MGRTSSDILGGRAVSTGSVYSTILIATTIAAAAPRRRVARLVDVGSGDSPYRGVLEHDLYVGIDRSPRGSDALLATADAAALPLVSASADGLLCTEVIEHVPDEHQLAAELARVAAPGACLVLSAPFVHGLHEQPYDFRRLTSIGLVTTLEAAGWRVDHIRPIGGPLVVAIDGVVRWFDGLLRRLGRAVTTPESPAFRVITAPSQVVQRGLAAVALSRGRSFGPIDPYRPSPRLTLGYVVAATLPEAADRVR